MSSIPRVPPPRAASLVALLALVSAGPAWAAGRPVTLAATDGTPLAGTLYEASSRPASAVVLVHMLGRSKEDWAVLAERLQDAGLTALALDLRGHGQSGGARDPLSPMVDDVRSAIAWLSTRANVRPGMLAVVGASLGANLAALAAAETPLARAVALVSPSLDYRGVRLDATVMRKLSGRPVWFAASTDDPYALRTLRELAAGESGSQQRLSGARAHGTALLAADPDLSQGLVDWLRQTLIF